MEQRNLIPRFYIRVQFSGSTKSSLIQNEQSVINLLPCLFIYTEISIRAEGEGAVKWRVTVSGELRFMTLYLES